MNNELQRWFFRMNPAERFFRVGRHLVAGFLIGRDVRRFGGPESKARFTGCRTWWQVCARLRPARQPRVNRVMEVDDE